MSGDETSDLGGRKRRTRSSVPGSHSAASAQRERSGGVRPAEFRRFLRQVGFGALIPGVGLIAAGRRKSGGLVLGLFLAGVVGVIVYAARAGQTGLIRLGNDPDMLGPLGMGLLALAAVWLLTAVASLYLLQPAGLRAPQRLLSAMVVIVAASLVVAPLSIGSQSAFTQLDLIDSVFADEDDQESLTIPDEATDEDPWAGQDRVNVLILGSDSGDDREGIRTDTIMVASIDTETGDTALFSLPRNLQYAPMPGGPLRDAYPDGYHGEPEAEYWLYAIYRNLPVEFPDYFEGIADPGAEAVKLVVGEALGLDISYYVMVNLRGFQYLVDALGGVELDVPYRIPIGTKELNGGCTRETGWVEEGDDQLLDGYHALWFARARCGPGPVSDDYERMRRQRCVIGAIAAQADPFNLLTRYQQLASAAKDTMSTDIGRRRLADFAELALKVKDAGIRTLPFTNEIIEYYDPDYDLIRQFVQDSLEPPDPSASPAPTDGGDVSASPQPSGSATDEESPAGTADRDETGGEDETGGQDETGADEPGSGGDESASGGPGDDSTDGPGDQETPAESEGAQSIDDVC